MLWLLCVAAILALLEGLKVDTAQSNLLRVAYDDPHPDQAALLYVRAHDANGQIAARNPLTGEFQPAAFIGALVPGTGRLIDGAYADQFMTRLKSVLENWSEQVL